MKFKKISIQKIKFNFTDLTMRKKLYYSFILISFIGIISGLVGLGFIQTTTTKYNYALINYGFAQGDIGKLGIEIEKSNSLVRDTLFLSDLDEQKNAKKALVDSLANIDDLLKTVSASMTTEQENVILNRIKTNLATYKQVRSTVISKGMGNFKDEGLKIFRKDGITLMNNISDDITLLLQTKIDTCNMLSNKLTILKLISIVVVFITILSSFSISLFLARFITKLISAPIDNLKKVADDIANGNLDVSIAITSKDELGELASSFSKMVFTLKNYITEISSILGSISCGNLDISANETYNGDFIQIKASLDEIVHSLSGIFLEIKDATFQVNSGASQVASTSQVLSQGATDQANSIEKLSSSIEKINTQVQNTSANADNTKSITMDLVKNIENSNNQMTEMLIAMNNIEKSSKDINNILKSINDIATETNLLALNAAIEAARAGEAGKGFAVVADEVRKLSNQSADAAKQTTLLVKDSITAVDKGRELANNTAKTLFELVNSVNNVTNLISDITTTSKEQAESINQLHGGILQIFDVVQSNSAIAEESAASSEELTAQAETLNIMIDKFKLKI